MGAARPNLGSIDLAANYQSNSNRTYSATMVLNGGTTLVITLTSSGSGGTRNFNVAASTGSFNVDGGIDDSTGKGVVNIDSATSGGF